MLPGHTYQSVFSVLPSFRVPPKYASRVQRSVIALQDHHKIQQQGQIPTIQVEALYISTGICLYCFSSKTGYSI